jgi:hypothetical protein
MVFEVFRWVYRGMSTGRQKQGNADQVVICVGSRTTAMEVNVTVIVSMIHASPQITCFLSLIVCAASFHTVIYLYSGFMLYVLLGMELIRQGECYARRVVR